MKQFREPFNLFFLSLRKQRRETSQHLEIYGRAGPFAKHVSAVSQTFRFDPTFPNICERKKKENSSNPFNSDALFYLAMDSTTRRERSEPIKFREGISRAIPKGAHKNARTSSRDASTALDWLG